MPRLGARGLGKPCNRCEAQRFIGCGIGPYQGGAIEVRLAHFFRVRLHPSMIPFPA